MISEFLLESLGAGIRFAQRRIEWDTSAHTFENEGIVFWFWNSPHFSNFFSISFFVIHKAIPHRVYVFTADNKLQSRAVE